MRSSKEPDREAGALWITASILVSRGCSQNDEEDVEFVPSLIDFAKDEADSSASNEELNEDVFEREGWEISE